MNNLMNKIEKNNVKGQCYRNAYNNLIDSEGELPYLVIGYCKNVWEDITFRHAWNLDQHMEIVDTTLMEDGEEYEYFEAFILDLENISDEEHLDEYLDDEYLEFLDYDEKSELDCIEENGLIVSQVNNEIAKGECYSNSFNTFMANKDSMELVIGYCRKIDSGFTFRHGWNMSNGKLVDTTLEDSEKFEYFEALKYDFNTFISEDVVSKTNGHALLGLNIEAELKCIEDNNLIVNRIDLDGCINPYIR